MSDHQCLHETDLALMAKSLEGVCIDVKDIKSALMGNGKEGLNTRVAIIERHLNSTPSAKALAFYASCGGGAVVFIALLANWAWAAI